MLLAGDNMNRKEEAVKLIHTKLEGKTFLSYKEIAAITGYHPKYLLKLKKEVVEGTISLKHGNLSKKPYNAISDKERDYIVQLYKRSHVSIKKFCKFYGKRSYSCIYNTLDREGLIKKTSN